MIEVKCKTFKVSAKGSSEEIDRRVQAELSKLLNETNPAHPQGGKLYHRVNFKSFTCHPILVEGTTTSLVFVAVIEADPA